MTALRYVDVLPERLAEFLREAAVLVAVFSILDKVLTGEISALWVFVVVGTSIYLFLMGVVIEVEASRRNARLGGPQT